MSIVIVGSGPVGLYTAICLARKGYPVHIVDKYTDNFTRPGVVAIQAGETIIRQLGRNGINVEIPFAGSFPETYYISDIQKALYAVAVKLGVQFTPAHFKSIQSDSITVEGSETPIPCDMLIDCSGESRQVVNYINSEKSPSPFQISKIAENPVKTNFIAYITMNNENAELLGTYKGTGDPVNEVLQFESLRAQGWSINDMPHWDMRRWENSQTEKRFCCYFEMPDDLARAPQGQQEKWLATMLKLKAGGTIDFALEEGASLKFRSFIVDPHSVENPFLKEGIYPFPVAVCGDALISAEYRKGTGIFNGIVGANGLVNATSFHQGKFHVDTEIFNRTMTESTPTIGMIENHKKDIKSTYQSRLNKLSNIAYIQKKLAIYFSAHTVSPQDETIKKGVLHQIGIFKQLVDNLLIRQKYHEACLGYEEVLSACKRLEENPSVEITERAKLYDLKMRICSNLERAYKGNNNFHKAESYLLESIQNCKAAVALIGDTEDGDLLEIKTNFSNFQKKLDDRKKEYAHQAQELPHYHK